MSVCVVQSDLLTLRERLSLWLGCPVSVAEARDLLERVGLIESALGWIAHDPRLLMLLFVRPGARLF